MKRKNKKNYVMNKMNFLMNSNKIVFNNILTIFKQQNLKSCNLTNNNFNKITIMKKKLNRINYKNVQKDVEENSLNKLLKNIQKFVKKFSKVKENSLIQQHKEIKVIKLIQ